MGVGVTVAKLVEGVGMAVVVGLVDLHSKQHGRPSTSSKTSGMLTDLG